MRLGIFDDASRPQRVPGRWLSFYLLGTKVSWWGEKRHNMASAAVGDCWCKPRFLGIPRPGIIAHEKGGN